MFTFKEIEKEKKGEYWRKRGKNEEERGEKQRRKSSCLTYSCVAIPELGILSQEVLNTHNDYDNNNHKFIQLLMILCILMRMMTNLLSTGFLLCIILWIISLIPNNFVEILQHYSYYR